MDDGLELRSSNGHGDQSVKHIEDLPAIDTSWPAWRFVIAAFILDSFIWGGAFAYGTWQEFYVSHPPFSSSSAVAISAIGTTALALNYAEMLAGILLCRKYPHLVQRGIWISLAVYVAAFLAASFSTEVWMLTLFQGVLAGAAGGFVYAPIYVYLSEWFVKRRALAGGCIFAGAGLGGFLFPIVLNALLPKVGFRWTLRIFGLLVAVCCGGSLIVIKPRQPLHVRQTGSVNPKAAPFDWRCFYDPVFVCLAFTIFVQGLSYSSIIVYLPTYTTSFANTFDAGFTLSVVNAASILGQIITGALCDRFPYTYVMFNSGIASMISIFALLRVSTTYAQVMGFSILMGLAGGGFSSTWFPACTDVADLRKMDAHEAGHIFGYLSIIRGTSAIIGPIIAGTLYKAPSKINSPVEEERWGQFGLQNFVLFIGWMSVATAAGSLLAEASRRWRMKRRTAGSK